MYNQPPSTTLDYSTNKTEPPYLTNQTNTYQPNQSAQGQYPATNYEGYAQQPTMYNQTDLYAKVQDPYAKTQDQYGKLQETYGKPQEMYGKTQDAYGKSRFNNSTSVETYYESTTQSQAPYGSSMDDTAYQMSYDKSVDPYGGVQDPYQQQYGGQDAYGNQYEGYVDQYGNTVQANGADVYGNYNHTGEWMDCC